MVNEDGRRGQTGSCQIPISIKEEESGSLMWMDEEERSADAIVPSLSCRLRSGVLNVRNVLKHKVKLGLGTGGTIFTQVLPDQAKANRLMRGFTRPVAGRLGSGSLSPSSL